jgi:hypothetical protein
MWVWVITPANLAVKTANRLHESFERDFPITPRIQANAGALFAQKSSVENLLLLDREIEVIEKIESALPDGTTLELRAGFSAQAGVATREPFLLNVRRGGAVVDAALPKARILKIEMAAPEILSPQGIVWEAIPESSRSKSTRILERRARRLLTEQGLLDDAKNEMRRRVSALVESVGGKVEFSKDNRPPWLAPMGGST